MSDHFFIGAYWGPRKESADECAKHAVDLLTRLSLCDEALQQWTRPQISDEGIVDLESVERAVPCDEKALKHILLAGQNHYDDKEKTIIRDLGFQVCLSTDIREDGIVHLDFHCGLYHEGSGLVNCCAISLPGNGVIGERLMQIGVLEKLMDSIVQSWEPDWGIVVSHEYLRLFPESSSKNFLAPKVGWMTYLSSRCGSMPALPEPYRVVSIGGKGHLVVVTAERFSGNLPTHVEAVKEVTSILEGAGLLVPLQIWSKK